MRRFIVAACAAGLTLGVFGGIGAKSPVVAHANAVGYQLNSGQCMYGGDYLLSQNIAYQFIMQTDGNAVEYLTSESYPMFYTGTHSGIAHDICQQSDGNLVNWNEQSNGQWTLGWQSGYSCGCSASFYTSLQSDGNLVTYRTGGSWVWMDGTYARPNDMQNVTANYKNYYPADTLNATWYASVDLCNEPPDFQPSYNGFYTQFASCGGGITVDNQYRNGMYGQSFGGHDASWIFQPFHYVSIGDDIWYWNQQGVLTVYRVKYIYRNQNVDANNPDTWPLDSDIMATFQTCEDGSTGSIQEFVEATIPGQ